MHLVVYISCVRGATRVCVCRQVHILVSSDAHFRRPDDHFSRRPDGGVPPVCLVVCVSCVWVGPEVQILVVRTTILGGPDGHFFDDFGQKSGHFSPFLGPWDPFGGGTQKRQKTGFWSVSGD